MTFQLVTTVVRTLVTSKSILDISTQIYGNINFFKTVSSDITTSIEALDFEPKLKMFDSIVYKLQSMEELQKNGQKEEIKEQSKTNTTLSQSINDSYFVVTDNDTIGQKTNPIKVAIYYLHDISQKINNDMASVRKIDTDRRTLYLGGWRCDDPVPLVKKLEAHAPILNSRMDSLLKLLPVDLFVTDFVNAR